MYLRKHPFVYGEHMFFCSISLNFYFIANGMKKNPIWNDFQLFCFITLFLQINLLGWRWAALRHPLRFADLTDVASFQSRV